jgi:hypothetical protein
LILLFYYLWIPHDVVYAIQQTAGTKNRKRFDSNAMRKYLYHFIIESNRHVSQSAAMVRERKACKPCTITTAAAAAAAAAAAPSTSNPTTADYWVGETIGEGSFGRVVHAQHKGSNQPVAIKVYDKTSVQKLAGRMESIWTERTLLQLLRASPWVVSLWSAFIDSYEMSYKPGRPTTMLLTTHCS